ncbi:MAG: polysaccharide pyruvyl transferase family protein [Gemmataceae bacterium]|nr:polysaccharide pyruvyl transferase family protein [Gemmataceae bacterium]
MRRTLVAGWFSIGEDGGCGATLGDLEARDIACDWLTQSGHDFDVASISQFPGGVDWRIVPPADYDSLLLVCGPFMPGHPQIRGLIDRFSHCQLWGLNLSILDADHEQQFVLLVERDGPSHSCPDFAFLSAGRRIPLVGVLRVHPQSEYGSRALHPIADQAIDELLQCYHIARIDIDTRLLSNPLGLGSPGEIEAIISRCDLVVTTRLHGMVYALKNGIPALVIDPIAGGGKVLAQAQTVEWPVVFTADTLEPAKLKRALEYCLTPAVRSSARQCGRRARRSADRIRTRFLTALDRLNLPSQSMQRVV